MPRRLFRGFFMGDIGFMKRAIELARKGAGRVSPNPMVGAVVVRDGDSIGEGYHAEYGATHAEVNAMGNGEVKGATLYVTLEPCNHYGHTPPCTEKIVSEKIRRVVVGSIDPNPRMQGISLDRLKGSGIDVDVGVLQNETDGLIRFYSHWIQTGRPYVTVKLALSGDGFIARPEGTPEWISCVESRTDVHRMRAEYDAVLVGTNTVRVDNPALTVREVSGRNPNRVVIDRQGRIDRSARVFAGSAEKVFYFSTVRRNDLHSAVHQTRLDPEQFNLSTILTILGGNNQLSVLVEGGASIAESFIRENLCNEVVIYRSLTHLGSGIGFDESTVRVYGFRVIDQTRSGVDRKITYRREHV
ncbi:MAG: bifunctional diaminohydroxyphosphoribosylaminopyrimidine deaminase/5-amino-6-(5-phosphoribosylamino)uracil reductase RibD [Fidelibacterota bacterium]